MMVSKWRTFGNRCHHCGELVIMLMRRAFAQDQPEPPGYCPCCGQRADAKELLVLPTGSVEEGKF